MPSEQFLNLTKEDFIKILSKGLHNIEVQKASGSNRSFLNATLDESLMNVDLPIQDNPDNVIFWSMDDNGLRTFNSSKVISVGI